MREAGIFDSYYNVIFYVSRGVMSDLNETVSVLAAVGEVAMQTSLRIKINTIAFSEGIIGTFFRIFIFLFFFYYYYFFFFDGHTILTFRSVSLFDINGNFFRYEYNIFF